MTPYTSLPVVRVLPFHCGLLVVPVLIACGDDLSASNPEDSADSTPLDEGTDIVTAYDTGTTS